MVDNSLVSSAEVNTAVSMINPVVVNILSAIVILLAGFVIGRLLEKLSLKLFEMIELDKIAYKKLRLKKLASTISRILSFIIYLIAIIVALNKLNITTTIITTIVILLIVVLVLFIVFGVNDIFANLFAGVIIRMKKNISLGDNIKIKDAKRTIQGKVESISTLNIRINTGKEELVIIPNTLLTKCIITKIRKN
ncbi:MAG: mechanosensitive ion channel domain-containing protein [Candidatus Woesearchaeota archaeon]